MKQTPEGFTAEFFVGNRQRLRQLFTGTAPIVITANGRMQQAATEAFPFHQDRNFWYLTGIDEPDIVLVMDKGRDYLILPERDTVQETFDGMLDPESLRAISGIEVIYSQKEGWKQLTGRIKKVHHVAVLGAAPRYIDVFGIYSNPARAVLSERLESINSDIELLDLRLHLSRMRTVKQPQELEALRRAIDITVDSLKQATRSTKLLKYQYEYELEAEIAKGFRARGARGHAFTPIVAGGPRACTMHYVENGHALNSKELVILDVGAEFGHYAADISRTVAFGTMSKRQKQLFEAVEAVQDYAFNLLKPGVLPGEYEKQVVQFMGEKLRELGLIKTIEPETVRQFFPHMTSHYLGLDTHDAGDYEKPLEPGTVLTVEPGIYVRDEGIGVRIEDDVLITEDGMENLSARLPRALS